MQIIAFENIVKMKTELKKELVKLAEEIISEQENLDARALKVKAASLYEQLAILNFTEQNLQAFMAPQAIESPKIEKPAEETIEKRAETVMELADTPAESEKTEAAPKEPAPEPESDEHAPDGTEFREDGEAITEPNTEKIKDIVAHMPAENEYANDLFNQMSPPQPAPSPEPESMPPAEPKQPKQPEKPKDDFRSIGVDYDNLPDFEPLNNKQKGQKPRSLNDRLNKGINIGLNERLSFIKHLFGGDASDYNRVLSQLNTFSSQEEAEKFIQLVVKPDYNKWEGKEEQEARFMQKIENKFS